MLLNTKNIGILCTTVLFALAVFFLYFPIKSKLDNLFGKVALNGFQTSFTPKIQGMVNQENQPVEWHELMRQPLFMTTGFTACNLSCPITMAFYTQLKSQLNVPATYAMLTVDPEYDNPARLKQFLKHFDPDFIGLRINDPAQMQKIIKELKLNISRTGSDISHTDYIYLFHPALDGAVIYTKPDVKLITQDLKLLTQAGQTNDS